MIEDLNAFLVSAQELAHLEEQLRQCFRECLQQPDRLRSYMQLMMMVRLGCEALGSLDTKGFLAQLKEDLQTQGKQARQQVEQQMTETKDSVEEISEKAELLQQEIKVRSDIVNDVIAGLGNVASDVELSQLQEQAANLLADVERRMKTLVELRNSQSFAQLLAQTAAQTAANNANTTR